MCAHPRESKKRRLNLLSADVAEEDSSVPSTIDRETMGGAGSVASAPSTSTPMYRKRQMERDRRDLINLRFSELHQLLRTLSAEIGSSQDHKAESMVDLLRPESRRINKECVLKDALLTLDLLRRQGVDARVRNEELTKQVDGMRAEMNDLRRDKQYLRNELQQSRLHNNMLWQQCQHQVKPTITHSLPTTTAPATDAVPSMGVPAPMPQRFKHEQCLTTPFATQTTKPMSTSQRQLGGVGVDPNYNATYNHLRKNTPDLLSIQEIAQLLGQGAQDASARGLS